MPNAFAVGSVATILVSTCAIAPAARAGDDGFEAARSRYVAYLRRPSFEMRTRGRDRFARTGDPRALALLARDYGRTIDPKDHEQYTIASVAARACRDDRHAPVWRGWREKHKRSRDAWLWYKALGAEIAAGDGTGALQAAGSARDCYLQSAALRALADGGEGEALGVLTKTLAKLPQKPQERAVLLGTCAAALDTLGASHFGTDEFRRGVSALIARLESPVADGTKLVIARHLAHLLQSDSINFDTRYWRALLAHEEERRRPRDGRYARSRRPTYFGVEGSGTRVVYVLDLSDTMLTPLSDAEKGRLRGPTTGKRNAEQRPEERLPWKRIRTRFDAAREFTKLSLRDLPEGTSFAVVVFGTKAELLRSTARLVRATKAAVARACRELDGYKAGPTAADAPHGTLLGYTNMHGGLRLAFKVTPRGCSGEYEYVDSRAHETGADTIFLLSDGAPTWDDWGPVEDKREPEDAVGHPESLVPQAESDTVEFCGPYWHPWYLVDDLRRLNLFRHVEINCVGLGEAREALLREIAEAGLGRVRILGAGK